MRNYRQREIYILSYIFQKPESDFKVEGWLSQQEEFHTTGLEGINTSLQFVKEWTLDHVQADSKYVKMTNRFAVSESGAVRISCEESPSLSVMYPDTHRPLVILSNHKTFMKISGKEYLAVAGDEDGCLYLEHPEKSLTQSCPRIKWINT